MMIVNEPYFIVLFRECLVQLAIIIYNVSLKEILWFTDTSLVDAAHSSDLITFVFRSHIKPIFQSIAAKVGSEPCCDWVRIAQKTPSWFFLQLLKLSC